MEEVSDLTSHRTKNVNSAEEAASVEIVAVVASAEIVAVVASEAEVALVAVAVAVSEIEADSVEEVVTVVVVVALADAEASTAMLLTKIRATSWRSRARRLPSELVHTDCLIEGVGCYCVAH
jgi:hypothetical protein